MIFAVIARLLKFVVGKISDEQFFKEFCCRSFANYTVIIRIKKFVLQRTTKSKKNLKECKFQIFIDVYNNTLKALAWAVFELARKRVKMYLCDKEKLKTSLI